MTLTAFRDWYWAGSPERRLIVHLLTTAIIAAIPLGAFGGQGKTILLILVSWDFGAWYMDKIYTARQAERRPAAAQ